MVEERNEDVFGVNGWDNQPPSNLLEKNRYKFKVKDIVHHQSSAGNACAKVVLEIEGLFLTDFLIMSGKMEWKYKQFLYSIGVRDKRKSFAIPKASIIGAEGLADISVRDRTFDDGSTMKENRIQSYSPIEEQTAPITDVPPEDTKPKKESKKETKKEEDDDVEDL